jgi:hypothetical protein
MVMPSMRKEGTRGKATRSRCSKGRSIAPSAGVHAGAAAHAAVHLGARREQYGHRGGARGVGRYPEVAHVP